MKERPEAEKGSPSVARSDMPYQVTVEFSGPTGTPWFNRMYFDEAGGTAQQAAAAAGAFWGAVDALIRDDVTWTTGTEVEELNVATGVLSSVNAITAVTGTGGDTTTDMATVLQGLVSWRTGTIVGGRELRGRTFIPGLTQNVNTAGLLSTAAQTAWQTAANNLIADANSNFVIWHRPVNGSGGGAASVASASVTRKFSVMRSRRD